MEQCVQSVVRVYRNKLDELLLNIYKYVNALLSRFLYL